MSINFNFVMLVYSVAEVYYTVSDTLFVLSSTKKLFLRFPTIVMN